MNYLKKINSFVTIIVLLVIISFTTSVSASQGSSEVHYLSFASDRHGNANSIESSMKGMPKNVKYVSLIGDMVGTGGGQSKAPSFFSSTIYDEVISLNFNNVNTNKDTSILWADHDLGVNNQDDANIVFANGGTESGPVKTGYNADKTEAYYIYGIAFYEMTNSEQAKIAAEKFEQWVDKVALNNSVPLIVECHVPLHYARGDNKGAIYWNNALNYAATGKKSPIATDTIIRNVIYLHGHNHTNESKTGEYSGEFYVPAKSSMEIGPDENTWSNIFYTYTTAGYLNQNNAASLISIWDKTITIKKYSNGKVVDDFYDTESKHSGKFASTFETNGINQIRRVSIIKIPNTATFKVKTKKIKASKLRKKKQVVKVFTVKNAKGVIKYSKVSGSKKLLINKKTGKVTVKKKTHRGTYKVKVKIKVKGTELYKVSTKTLTAKVKVK